MVMAETVSSSPTSSPVKNDQNNLRKNKKPMMEKKRRARINTCLNQLKSLVLQASKKDSSQFNKLEKADILELTVNHMRILQRQRASGEMTSDASVLSKYRAGFTECANEVCRYIDSVKMKSEVKDRLLGHLSGCLQAVDHVERIPHQHTTPLPLPFSPQQALVTGVFVHPSPPSQFQTGLNFALPPLVESSMPSFVAPVSTLPLSCLPVETTTTSAVVVPARSSAFQEVSSSGREAGHVGSTPSSSPSSSSSSTLPGSVDAASLMPLSAFAASAQTHSSVAPPDRSSAATEQKSSVLDAAPSTVKSSSLSVKTLNMGSAWLPLDLKKHEDSAAPSSSSPSSSSDLADKVWRPW